SGGAPGVRAAPSAMAAHRHLDHRAGLARRADGEGPADLPRPLLHPGEAEVLVGIGGGARRIEAVAVVADAQDERARQVVEPGLSEIPVRPCKMVSCSSRAPRARSVSMPR